MEAEKTPNPSNLGQDLGYGLLTVIEGFVHLGVWGSAGFAVAMGKFMLGGALAALGLGVFLRFKRLRMKRRARRG
ncbi:hypothetical protein ACS5PN_25855 [Roseateles sp. NT4]|uniref:hypothetical protein n=1 Tax=Roseateles sp. NT4 TaxID=3453715 RepID=UPI003EECD6CC